MNAGNCRSAPVQSINGVLAFEMQLDDVAVQTMPTAILQPERGGKENMLEKKKSKRKNKMIAAAVRFSETVSRWLAKEQKRENLIGGDQRTKKQKKSIQTYIESPSSSRELAYLWQFSWNIINCLVFAWPQAFAIEADAYLQQILKFCKEDNENWQLEEHNPAVPGSGAVLTANRDISFFFLGFCAANDCNFTYDCKMFEHVLSSFEYSDGDLAMQIFRDCFAAVASIMKKKPIKFCNVAALAVQLAPLAHACRIYRTFYAENKQFLDDQCTFSACQSIGDYSRKWLLETSVWYARQNCIV